MVNNGTRLNESRVQLSDSLMRRRALHFAGHAVVATLEEIPVEHMRLNEDSCVFLNRSGPRFIDPGVMLDLPDRWPYVTFDRAKLAESIVRIALAGPITEQTAGGGPLDLREICSDEVDWGLAWKTAGRLWGDVDERLTYIATQSFRLERAIKFDLCSYAIRLISESLLSERSLDRGQVSALFERAREATSEEW